MRFELVTLLCTCWSTHVYKLLLLFGHEPCLSVSCWKVFPIARRRKGPLETLSSSSFSEKNGHIIFLSQSSGSRFEFRPRKRAGKTEQWGNESLIQTKAKCVWERRGCEFVEGLANGNLGSHKCNETDWKSYCLKICSLSWSAAISSQLFPKAGSPIQIQWRNTRRPER